MLTRTLRQYLPRASLLGLILVYSTSHASSEDIVDIATSDNLVETIKSKAEDLALKAANKQVDLIESKALKHGWKHLDLQIGWESGKPAAEILSVYGLSETKNWFTFNQSSFGTYDNRNTINTGFGARHLSDDETLILGANAFIDYEISSGHRRRGAGVEAITSLLSMRANMYKAQSGTITYEGINEDALDGYDYTVTAQLPYLYSSNVYFKRTNWSDGANFNSNINESGFDLEPLPNLFIKLASQKKDNETSNFTTSITYSQSFGQNNVKTKNMQNGRFSNQLKSLRHQLYQPVKRENRIAKKSIKLGLTVSGY